MKIPFVKQNHQKFLDEMPKITQSADDYHILLSAKAYKSALLDEIKKAKHHIYVVALYLEKDEAGREIINALYQAKKANPNLTINVLVDWHRAQRGRIGEEKSSTNAGYYYQMSLQNEADKINYYGVPVSRREVLGILHLKGFIIDDTVIYSGASINNVYLHHFDKYRCDRYHVIKNSVMANAMIEYINTHIISADAVQALDVKTHQTRKAIKNEIKAFRHQLTQANYHFNAEPNNSELTVSPIVGLGKASDLNKTIHHLLCIAKEQVIFCTPYFNLPNIVMKDVLRLLKSGKKVEFIVGDKVANDFYIPEDQPFNISGGLPYLYELNLRKFIMRLQHFVDNGQLTIRLWKHEDNSYHLKGLWVDDEWFLVTGNNINPRAWRLDLENGILVRDPNQLLKTQKLNELDEIRRHTLQITHYQQIQASQFYPTHIHKLITRLSRIKVDRIIKRLL